MAEVFQGIDGSFRPRFVCDGCGQPIADPGMALAVYGESPQGGHLTAARVFHAHKHTGCQARVRRKAGHAGWSGPDEGLVNHLVLQAASLGVGPAELAEAYESLMMLGMVPPAEPPRRWPGDEGHDSPGACP